MEKPLFVGLDVGGTTMKAGVVDDCGTPLGPVSLPTEPGRGQELGLERMCETIRQSMAAANVGIDDIAAIGVATPGTMDIPRGIIIDPPNLKPWRNVPVRDHIQSVFRVPTAFQNDANAAAYGEFWVGVGKGVHSLVLFTLGTGIGGGIIIGGAILEGEHSHGAELGHTIIEMTNPRLCPCGRLGCLEAYASATSVVKRTMEALEKETDAALEEAARKPGGLTAREIFDASAAGSLLADRIVDETAYYLAVGTTNMLHTIDPEMVAFAGGMTAAGPSFLKRIRKYVLELAMPIPAQKCKIMFAKLGGDAGHIGAAACARSLYKRTPAVERADGGTLG